MRQDRRFLGRSVAGLQSIKVAAALQAELEIR